MFQTMPTIPVPQEDPSSLRGLGGTWLLCVVLLISLGLSSAAMAKDKPPAEKKTPSIAKKTKGMQKFDGYFPLYWEETSGKLWMEISRFDTETLHSGGLAAGLGSNDIGLDRGQLGGSRIIQFERVGPQVFMVQPNTRYRATTHNPEELKAVKEAFAPSILWGFRVAAETNGSVLVELTEFLIRDTHRISGRLKPGSYRLDKSRSAIFLPMIQNFPKNTELEVTLTFTLDAKPSRRLGRGDPSFQGVGDVAATAEAATLRVHQSFVELPDGNYEPRGFDPRSGYGVLSYLDYSAPLGEPMQKRWIRRHRLQKKDPNEALGEAVEPILYYLDRGTPEPIRTALLEGGRWWEQAFEAAGFRHAFRLEMMPEGASLLDVRYNTINWTHRSTRGWSYGDSVTDPRTGEIIKGNVNLGSLRVRQDYLIAVGLLAPYTDGTESPDEVKEWALARIRQLSAHEIGHTLGLGHNYYNSQLGRISVMDYPHPLITLNDDGSFDFSEVYDHKIGDWDKVAIDYGYREFPPGTVEKTALATILEEAWARDVIYLSNQDLSANPKVDQWANGTNPASELNRLMKVRRAALDRFDERVLQEGQPLATMEEILVPLFLHHRFQVTSASSTLGGIHYTYGLRGDGRDPVTPVSAADQEAALEALLVTLDPAELTIPAQILDRLPPRPSGYGRNRELFPRDTGPMFDTISPATVAASHTIGSILKSTRTARMVQQHAQDTELPSLQAVLAKMERSIFGALASNPYEAEVSRAIERVFVDKLMTLAATATMPQVRAIASSGLQSLSSRLGKSVAKATDADAVHYKLLVSDIGRFINRPAEAYKVPEAKNTPPGAPIGEPALRWLGEEESWCPSRIP